MALHAPPECPLAPTEGLLPLNMSSLQVSLTCWRSAEHFRSSARLWLPSETQCHTPLQDVEHFLSPGSPNAAPGFMRELAPGDGFRGDGL